MDGLGQSANKRSLQTFLAMSQHVGGERKRKNLIRLGVEQGKAYAYSRTRKGGWAIAQSPILVTTIPLERLRKRGYESMSEYYLKVSPMFNEPLYTRGIARCAIMYSGVRGLRC